MTKKETISPALVVEYTDRLEGFQGWLVVDSLDHQMCAGGLRVQKGLTLDSLVRMARNMTCKMRMAGLRVDGAKSGIDYDPASPGRREAISRFMAAIAPYIENRYSMGPDLNVEMTELDSIAEELGIPAVKIAVARAQGLTPEEFRTRYAVLKKEVEGFSLGRLRVGYGVAVAALAVLDHLKVERSRASVAIQGFGALARAAAFGLARKGVKVIALADHEKCLIDKSGAGMDIGRLLDTTGPLLPEIKPGNGINTTGREEIVKVHCDILIPAAVENTITRTVAKDLQVNAVVPGANLAVTEEADQILYDRGIIVLPDLLSGSGGSLSMEGLFGPEEIPAPEDLLNHVEQRMSALVNQVLERSIKENIPPSRAAHCICMEAVPQPGSKPYGTQS